MCVYQQISQRISEMVRDIATFAIEH